MSANPKNSYYKLIELALPSDDALFHQFATIFLADIPDDRLAKQPVEWWVSFLNRRFKQFKHSVQSGSGIAFTDSETIGNSYALDIIYPNSDKLFFTLQTLVRDYELRVTLSVHPMIAVDNPESVSQIARATHQDDHAYSVVYIEFEAMPESMTPDILKNQIHRHMVAVQESYRAQQAIATKVATIQTYLNQSSTNQKQQEWHSLLNWLQDNFFYYGYQAFNILDNQALPIQNSAIGILSDTYAAIDTVGVRDALHKQVIRKIGQSHMIYFDRIQAKSPVQRFSRLMRLSFKFKAPDGTLIDHNFIGILRRSSLHVKNTETPLIHLKVQYIFDQKKLVPGTYDYYEVIRLLTGIPKFELFRSSKETLLSMVNAMFSVTNPNKLYCFARKSQAMYCFFIYIPFHLYTPENCRQISDYMRTQFSDDADMDVVQIYDSDKPRMHIYFDCTTDQALPDFSEPLNSLIQPWKDQVIQAFKQVAVSHKQIARVMAMLPADYQARTQPEQVVKDYEALVSLSDSHPIQTQLTRFTVASSKHNNKVSHLLIYTQTKLRLYDVMPLLTNLGLLVLDQLTTRLGDKATSNTQDYQLGYIQSYRIMTQDKQPLDEGAYASTLGDTIKAIFTQKIRNDGLNRLVLQVPYTYHEVAIIRTYCQLYAQIKPVYASQLTSVLTQYPVCTESLITYFIHKFNPDLLNKANLDKDEQAFYTSIQPIQTIDHDTIFRDIFDLIKHTHRTNAYIPYKNKPYSKTAISIKLNSRLIKFMPQPVPWVEVFVQDTKLDGCHSRFGLLSRGGIRWSSRMNDFRTEVLGLVKAQTLKNVMIVPDGSKGGFVIHGPVDNMAVVTDQYQRFIGALLDITDNQDESGAVTHPDHCVIYDGLDPYLVVAADKGTATFSDLANDVAITHKFWLGDAFASGGKTGYDHKKEGITAKGAWECVRLHFASRGIDCQTDIIRVVGIGDMAGDVFGNGLLRSRSVKLIAAFNHTAIFVDPDPDPARSYAERKRLFESPALTWFDYDREILSAGGGIFSRDSKSIALSPEIRQCLGITHKTCSGVALIQAILKASVDLIWFGGIGTYIKATTESHDCVGDPANDTCRIDAVDVQAKVIGEGANLGITSLGRHELGRNGVSLNTDAIDNAAGVNMSDYEVNLKILVHRLIQAGRHKPADRIKLLSDQVHPVTELCLANNRQQHAAISHDSHRLKANPAYFYPALDQLMQDQSDRDLYHIATGLGTNTLTRSDISILQARVKQYVISQVPHESVTLTTPYFKWHLMRYFPEVIQNQYSDYIMTHPLATTIAVMQLVNHVVNHAGAGFIATTQARTNASVATILQVYCETERMMGAIKQRQLSPDDRLAIETDITDFVTQAILYGTPQPIDNYTDLFLDYKKNNTRQTGFFMIACLANDLSVEAARDFLNDYDAAFGFSLIRNKLATLPMDTKWARKHVQDQYCIIDDQYMRLYKLALNQWQATGITYSTDSPSMTEFRVMLSDMMTHLNWTPDMITVLTTTLNTVQVS